MTKVLSELLAAKEPDFRLAVQRLERAGGGQAHDIRLTGELLAAARAKLAELNLDPGDTTGPELYQCLHQKVLASDKELARVLHLEPLEPGFLEDLAGSLSKLVGGNDCFALKASAARKLFRANPPKRAMKRLGYRSLDSYLKHETLAGLLASARICESEAWHKAFVSSYKKLSPSDFESRQLSFAALDTERWTILANDYTRVSRHNILGFNEAGIVALLPMGSYPTGALMTMFLLALHAANEVLATSSYLRLHQVRADFGRVVAGVVDELPQVASPIDSQPLSWRTVHEFLVGGGAGFEPQLVSSEARLLQPADILANLSPALEFWSGTGHLAHLTGGDAVSLNPLDAALSYLNRLPFAARVNHHFREDLWRHFWQGYLQAEIIGEKLLSGLRLDLAGPRLAPEFIASEAVT